MVSVRQFDPTGLPGEDVAVVTMPTAGKCKPDASDIRVVTPGGTVIGRRVLTVGPGDTVTVAFAPRAEVRKYYLYFGNAGAARAGDLEIRRGLLMETWRNPGGSLASLQQVEGLFDRASQFVGRGFRKRVFLGHSTFGADSQVVSKFVGWLVCPAEGEYTFCTSSTDASFLLIDDQLVVSNPGRHRPQTDARMQGGIQLTAGLHKLTMYHANVRAQFIVVAAWRPPGAKRIWPIPASAFAEIFEAEPGAMESYGRAMTIDFLPVYVGESQVADRYYQRYRFEALTTGNAPRNIRWQWDFGDGMTSNHKQVDHVYLLQNDYAVKLTTRTYAGELVRTHTLRVSRPWDRLASAKPDDLTEHARIVAGYDFGHLTSAQTMCAVRMLAAAGMSDAVLAAGDALIRKQKAGSQGVRIVLREYANVLIERGRASEAVGALKKAQDMPYDASVSAELLALAGTITLKHLKDDDGALRLFQRTVDGYGHLPRSAGLREARIGIGDIWRARGEYEKAMNAYVAAGPLPSRDANKAAVRRGDLARYAEDMLRQGQFKLAIEYVDTWEQELPVDRLAGYSALFRVLAMRGLKQHGRAAQQAEDLVKVNPTSTYSPRLLMLAAESHGALGEHGKRAELLKKVVRDYPESPLASEAARELAGL